jgi:hypothetical protein
MAGGMNVAMREPRLSERLTMTVRRRRGILRHTRNSASLSMESLIPSFSRNNSGELPFLNERAASRDAGNQQGFPRSAGAREC